MSAQDEFQPLSDRVTVLEQHFSDDLGGRNVRSFRNARAKGETGGCRSGFSGRHAAEPKAGVNVAT